jgi:glutathione S-transferase
VLRTLRHTQLVAELAVLEGYRLRCEERPAFRKALADQLIPFAANAPSQTQ